MNEFGGIGSNSSLDDHRTRVLLIDDQALIGKVVSKMLGGQEDIEFRYCSDPAGAVHAAEEFSPTIMLLDLVMPDIDGLTLLREFRAREATREVPIIVLSGKEEADTKAEAFALGANDYMVKLPDTVEVLARIRHHSRGYISLLQRNTAMSALELRNRFITQTFGRYLSDDVVGQLLETPAALQLGGESRTVTIMMCDLRGFTNLSERHPAEEVVAMVNNFLGVMTDVILKYYGTIIEFLGDAILAIFGAPVARDDDACNAVACTVEMQLAMETVNQINRSKGLPELQMGVGLNTGEVAVGNIGSEKRVKYGIVGRHVNLTARIESYTIGRQILVSESTVEKTGPILLVAGQMEFKPKGVKEPITVHDVVGIGGKYNLYLPEIQEEELHGLPAPLEIRFTIIKGKDAGDQVHDGRIVRMSHAEAEIRADVSAELRTNLKFKLLGAEGKEIPGDLYAKVIGERPNGFRVHFTAIPPENAAFLDGLLFWRS